MTLLARDERIETERLVLRRITRDDLPFYARIHADPDVARYLAHGRPRLLDETMTWLDATLRSYQELALGQIAICRKADGILVGRCGLNHIETETEAQPDGTRLGYYFPAQAPPDRAHVAEVELGYTLDRDAWGQGYAQEAVRGVWDYTRSRRPDAPVVSLIHPENARSLRLADRFGLTLVDRVTIWDRPFDRYAWPAPRDTR